VVLAEQRVHDARRLPRRPAGRDVEQDIGQRSGQRRPRVCGSGMKAARRSDSASFTAGSPGRPAESGPSCQATASGSCTSTAAAFQAR
jgi:hypothetical protein